MGRRPKIGKSANAKAAKPKKPPVVKETLTERLGRPVFDNDLVRQISGPLRQSAFEHIKLEIERFRSASSAMHRSHHYQRLALSKVYEVWRELSLWTSEDRGHLLSQLDYDNDEKTERGGGLHVLLRSLITYTSPIDPDAPKADHQKARQAMLVRVSRDAGAIMFALRQNVEPADFVQFVARYPGGLDRMAKDGAAARRGEAVKIPKRFRPKKLKLAWPSGLEDAVARRVAAGDNVTIYLVGEAGAKEARVACAYALKDGVEEWRESMSDGEAVEPSVIV